MADLRLVYIFRRRMMSNLAFERHDCVAKPMRCHDESREEVSSIDVDSPRQCLYGV